MKKSNLASAIADITQDKPKGGARLEALLERAEQKETLRIFVPWAAPSTGRQEAKSQESATIDWLFGEGGLARTIGKYIAQLEVVVMPADSYARRNGFCMTSARSYWSNVRRLMTSYTEVFFLPSSQIEAQPVMSALRAQESYALERLGSGTAQKIVQSAAKYSGLSNETAYEMAAEYSMFRAAEARFVEENLQALWVSLNWPERDSMCGNTPRIYIPEDIRAPWLKETI